MDAGFIGIKFDLAKETMNHSLFIRALGTTKDISELKTERNRIF